MALIERVKARPCDRWAFNLGNNYLGETGAITEAEVREHFGNDVADEALTHRAISPPISEFPRPSKPYLPPCAGMVAVFDPEGCAKCAAQVRCARMIELVGARLVERFGSIEPKKQRERDQANERQRRRRKRLRDEAVHTRETDPA